MSVKLARVFGILAFVVSLSRFVEAATGGPVNQDVSSGIFAAAAGYFVLRLISMLRGR